MTSRRALVGLAGGLAGLAGLSPLPALAVRAAETAEAGQPAQSPTHNPAAAASGWMQRWDVVVVGSGGAGLAAAIAALEAGARRVAVLEKAALAGGHTMASTGSLNAYDPEGQSRMGRVDTTERYFDDTFEGGGRLADPALVKTMVEESEAMLAWMKRIGVAFDPVLFEAYSGAFPRAHRTILHRSGYVYVERLLARARALGAEVFFRTRADQLEMIGGRAAGVWASDPSGILHCWRSDAVVLATGGFGASLEMRSRWAPELGSLFGTTYSVGFPDEDPATGDGIRMAEAAGAALRDMEAVMAIPFWGGRVLDYPGAEIFLTSGGVRFTNEAQNWEDVLKDLMAVGEASFWIVTDSRSRKGSTFAAKVQQGTVRSAATLEDLARQMRVSERVLAASMRRYNDAATAGLDPDFGRRRFTQRIETPPYYFGRERFDVHYTCGGIAITTEGEVRRADAKGLPSSIVIPGLFAAGETTGGVHGRFRLGGNGLTDCFVFGRRAGRAAALFAAAQAGAIHSVGELG